MPEVLDEEVTTEVIDWETLVNAHDPGPGYYEAYRFRERVFVIYDENDPLYD